jgi:hypothetical protein
MVLPNTKSEEIEIDFLSVSVNVWPLAMDSWRNEAKSKDIIDGHVEMVTSHHPKEDNDKDEHLTFTVKQAPEVGTKFWPQHFSCKWMTENPNISEIHMLFQSLVPISFHKSIIIS